MPKLALQIKAVLENVTDLRPQDDDYMIVSKIKCNSCQEIHSKSISMTISEERELSKGRSSSNLVMNCSFCKKELTAKFLEPTSKQPLWQPYSPPIGISNWQTITIIEARGLDFIDLDFSGKWKCKSIESSTLFENIEFEDLEWTDYDEKGQISVSIMELESQWVRA